MADLAVTAGTVLTALLTDALTGEPRALYARAPHPAVLLGRAISDLEGRLLRPGAAPARQRAAGIVLAALVTGGGAAAGLAVAAVLGLLPLGWLWTGIVASSLLAQRSLAQHVAAVTRGLRRSLPEGRAAVALIVGRDPDRLDGAGVGRAAVESLAENLADGVIAPLLWGLAFGLPGMCAYKAINTLDSMVGHRSQRHRHLGWASARLDDLVNLPASRATALLVTLAAPLAGGSWRGAVRTVRRDARRHRSPNAGWPEAAMAGALGLRLAGPRSYAGTVVDDAWMGDGRAEVAADDIDRALRLAWAAWGLATAMVASLVVIAWP